MMMIVKGLYIRNYNIFQINENENENHINVCVWLSASASSMYIMYMLAMLLFHFIMNKFAFDTDRERVW